MDGHLRFWNRITTCMRDVNLSAQSHFLTIAVFKIFKPLHPLRLIPLFQPNDWYKFLEMILVTVSYWTLHYKYRETMYLCILG